MNENSAQAPTASWQLSPLTRSAEEKQRSTPINLLRRAGILSNGRRTKLKIDLKKGNSFSVEKSISPFTDPIRRILFYTTIRKDFTSPEELKKWAHQNTDIPNTSQWIKVYQQSPNDEQGSQQLGPTFRSIVELNRALPDELLRGVQNN